MAPQRVLPQDNRSESSKERQATTSSTLKARRTASSLVTANSNLANVTAAPTVAEAAAQQSNADAHGVRPFRLTRPRNRQLLTFAHRLIGPPLKPLNYTPTAMHIAYKHPPPFLPLIIRQFFKGRG